MKKLLSICFILLGVSASAQFRLAPSGVVCERGAELSTVDYVIEGASSQALYEASLEVAQKMSEELDQAHLSKMPPREVVLDGIDTCVVALGGSREAYSLYYRVSVEVGEGSLQLHTPEIFKIYTPQSELFLCGNARDLDEGDLAIFSERGALKRSEAKTSVEEYFNDLAAQFVEQVRLQLP